MNQPLNVVWKLGITGATQIARVQSIEKLARIRTGGNRVIDMSCLWSASQHTSKVPAAYHGRLRESQDFGGQQHALAAFRGFYACQIGRHCLIAEVATGAAACLWT
jgi:crotonobetainyl-CoA:carnitine CoA-transferase CaiB-like acyl-CoA transferase